MSLRGFSVDLESKELERLRQRLSLVVDDHVGIVSQVFEHFREPDDPYLFNHTTLLSATERFTGLGAPPGNNGGAGLTKTRSVIGAIGEALERYACSIFDHATMLFGSYDELTAKGVPCFPPERIALYSELQYDSPGFPFNRFTRSSRVAWERCECLTAEPPGVIYYPASLIYMPYQHDHGGTYDHGIERAIAPSISTGQACATTMEMATMSGLMEDIERDAFTIAWHTRMPAPIIDSRSSEMISTVLAERFSVCPVEIVLNYLTLDVDVPVVIATGVDRKNPAVSCILGVSAHLDPEVAALKALIELAQDRFYVKFLARARIPIEPVDDYSIIDDFEKRVVLYNHPGMIQALDFLRKAPPRVMSFAEMPRHGTGDPGSDLERVLSLVRAAGGTVIRKDCTTEDLRQVGVFVAKAIVPEFQALEGDHNLRFFGCERLYKAPLACGYLDVPRDERLMNPEPHPLP